MSNPARLRQRADEKSCPVSKKTLIILRKMPGMEKKIMDTKESSCQTELDEILRRQMEEFEDEWEQVRGTMEKESAEEKEDFEMRVRDKYHEIIKA